jgi:hypothetical protein
VETDNLMKKEKRYGNKEQKQSRHFYRKLELVISYQKVL